MDPEANPFRPGAGTRPPALVGRDAILEQARVLISRASRRIPEQGILLTGLRGVGKTVLLKEISRRALATGATVVEVESPEDHAFIPRLAAMIRQSLYALDREAGFDAAVRRGLGVLRSFIGAVRVGIGPIELGIDVDPERGVADSGDLELDLPDLLVAVGKAAEARRTVMVLLVDELQYVSRPELAAIMMSMHRNAQEELPLVLIAAGLPTLPALTGEARSYAERLFSYPQIGSLPELEAAEAIRGPLRTAGVDIEGEALLRICRVTSGYPYFLQEWGKHAWNGAASSPLTVADVEAATGLARASLDVSFFRVRYDRLRPQERRFLRAMAEHGAGACRLAQVAATLGRRPESLGPVRASLIGQGMVYSPEHGKVAFTVPMFDEFMKRAVPTL